MLADYQVIVPAFSFNMPGSPSGLTRAQAVAQAVTISDHVRRQKGQKIEPTKIIDNLAFAPLNSVDRAYQPVADGLCRARRNRHKDTMNRDHKNHTGLD